MNIKYLSLFAVIALGFLTQPVAAAEAPPKHILSLTSMSRLKTNDSPEAHDFIPIMFLFYRNFGFFHPSIDFNLIVAGLFNRAELSYKLNSAWSLDFGAEGLILVAGDSPHIDGEGFSEALDFDGHRFGGDLGPSYRFKVFGEPMFSSLSIETHFYRFSGRPVTANYQAPSPYAEFGPTFKLERLGRPPSPLKLYGWWPSIRLSRVYRSGNKTWGLSSFSKKVDSAFRLGFNSASGLRLSDRVSIVEYTSLAYVSKADRLNAVTGGSLGGAGFLEPFLSDAKSDRSAKLSLGPRIFLEPRKLVAIRPYYFGAVYRELTPSRHRTQFVNAGAVEIFGTARPRFNWQFRYGAANGLNNSKTLIHEVAANLTYQFLP